MFYVNLVLYSKKKKKNKALFEEIHLSYIIPCISLNI